MTYLDDRLDGTVELDAGAEESLAAPASSPTREIVEAAARGSVVTIRCRSEVTVLHVANLVADLSDAAVDASMVIVDLSRTSRIDAAGLGALVSGARACRDAGSHLCIVGAQGMVGRALRFTGLSRALSTHATVDEAMRRA